MSFINDNDPVSVQRRNWNLLFGDESAVVPPTSLNIFYGFQESDPFVVTSFPLDERDAFLLELSSYGTAGFEDLGAGDFGTFLIGGLSGLPGESVRVTAQAGIVQCLGSAVAGRWNTTPAGSQYLVQQGATSVLQYTFLPSISTFDAFGIFITDPGDFVPADYEFSVDSALGTFPGSFSLLSRVPTANGCLAFWGFTLETGNTINSVSLTWGATNDIIGLDDVIFGFKI